MKTTGIVKTTKTIQTSTNKGLSPGLVEITEFTEMRDTTRIWGANHGPPTKRQILPWPICRNVSEDFCCINYGGFSRGFSEWIFLGTFSRKNEEKNPARKSAKKSGGSKRKIREKSVLPKAGPKDRFRETRMMQFKRNKLPSPAPAPSQTPIFGSFVSWISLILLFEVF